MTTATGLKLSVVRFGLAARILVAGIVVAASIVFAFVFNARGLASEHREAGSAQRSQEAALAATQIESLVLELERDTGGFVRTADDRFLASWRSALRQLPARAAVSHTDGSGRASARIDSLWRSYVRDWSQPLIALARRNPRAARARLAGGEGQGRLDALRAVVEPAVAADVRAAAGARQRAADAENSTLRLGFTGTVIRVLLVLGLIGYLLRYAIGPLRHIAGATERVAGGELGFEVAERGAGEVRRLAVAFNEMSRSLAGQRQSLAEQNSDLERLANVLRAVLDSTIDGILLSDTRGDVQLANRPMLQLTRELEMAREGTVVDRLLSVEQRMADPRSYRAAMERLRAGPDEPTFDEFEDSVSGRVFQGFTAPVHDDRGGFLGRVWTLRDVSEQRELDRLKDEFVATVSHELRTPLTSMMGFLEMIREGEAGEITEEQKRFLAIVYRSSERLQRLVGDLLFVARLDAKGLQLQFSEIDVAAIVEEAAESSGALARSRRLDLRAEIEPVPVVRGDSERIAQLVANLISNAIKFTPEGGVVTVRAVVAGERAAIEVADTGIGIPMAEQARIFERFFRSSTATEQAIPGTGLGLVITKAIAEAHGGSISVRSEPGAGTCFRVELPLLQVAAA
jgi:signal transduction histidine kinase/CHASE3 domain sensor protein